MQPTRISLCPSVHTHTTPFSAHTHTPQNTPQKHVYPAHPFMAISAQHLPPCPSMYSQTQSHMYPPLTHRVTHPSPPSQSRIYPPTPTHICLPHTTHLVHTHAHLPTNTLMPQNPDLTLLHTYLHSHHTYPHQFLPTTCHLLLHPYTSTFTPHSHLHTHYSYIGLSTPSTPLSLSLHAELPLLPPHTTHIPTYAYTDTPPTPQSLLSVLAHTFTH
jgi:hypothetical protein